ncbi:MAG: DUF3783 domain-containing protein, partial [Oscillospiraceae bacterium]|nr:DUF3783 domain-containing protein [Oscillospiraceae bacterium]
MRSRIRNNFSEKILIYGTGGKTEGLEKICLDSGILPIKIGDDSLTERVGMLAMRESDNFSAENSTESANERECVIFCGLGEKKLDRILKAIRQNIPGGIPLKAVLTASNSKMTLEELLSELQK